MCNSTKVSKVSIDKDGDDDDDYSSSSSNSRRIPSLNVVCNCDCWKCRFLFIYTEEKSQPDRSTTNLDWLINQFIDW